MRLRIIVIASLALTGCGGKTPSCTDDTVAAQITRYAKDAVTEGLLQNDPDVHLDQVMSGITIALVDITTTTHDKGIDKHSCAANLRVNLPPGIAALKDHYVFQQLARSKLDINVSGNAILTPVTYTTYRSEKDDQLVIRAEGEKVPARFIQRIHKAGGFDSDLNALPDLRGGLTIYSTPDKNVLFEPAQDGSLQFRINYQNTKCRAWMQTITEEHGDTMIYDNLVVGCTVSFSRLGAIMLVEHTGCELMAKSCYPDGVYQKQ